MKKISKELKEIFLYRREKGFNDPLLLGAKGCAVTLMKRQALQLPRRCDRLHDLGSFFPRPSHSPHSSMRSCSRPGHIFGCALMDSKFFLQHLDHPIVVKHCLNTQLISHMALVGSHWCGAVIDNIAVPV